MPNASSSPLVFYPAYCFSLSPTHSAWARLTAADVHALRERAGFEGQNLYFYLNHPIKWIRIVGVITTFDIYPNRITMILDDSSGATIEVTCGRKTPPPALNITDVRQHGEHLHGLSKPAVAEREEDKRCHTATRRDIDLKGIDIGSVVKIKGGIGSFRGQKQVLLERISIVPTTTEEAAAWAETTAFRRDILEHPWVVSVEEEQRVRKKAEGLDRERKLRAEKERRRSAKALRTTRKDGDGTRRRGNETGRQGRKDAERRHRVDAQRNLGEEEAIRRRKREEEVMRRIEEEDRLRLEEEEREREEEEKRQREEVERKRKEEEQRQREEEERKQREEERERLVMVRRQKNEARERALRDMGAGR